MRPIKFVHCADLHIDTPFKGISEIQPDLRELLYQSTYISFNNIIELAINENVDCVLIAGDIYDSEDKSLVAQLRFRDGLNRLSEANIATFIAYGNHDPLNSWSATLKWPKDVFVFPGDKVECFPLVKNGEIIANVYGISFPKRDIYDNLALKFTPAPKGALNIGLLHTNIGTNTGHMPYAPCTIEDLAAIGMDYWALGHIHKHNILKNSYPAIVYSGCSQGRNPREIGAKGCCLVTLETGADPDIKFVATDIIRYKSDSIDISSCLSIEELVSSIIEKCKEISSELNKCNSIIRLSLTGRTDLNAKLQKGNSIAGLLETIREQFTGTEPSIWLEKLILNTAGTYNLDSLRNGSDFIADIISIFDELENIENHNNWEELHEALKPLFSKWQGSDYLDELSDEELLALASEAKSQMLDMLITD